VNDLKARFQNFFLCPNKHYSELNNFSIFEVHNTIPYSFHSSTRFQEQLLFLFSLQSKVLTSDNLSLSSFWILIIHHFSKIKHVF
jgi:hypothetical protein